MSKQQLASKAGVSLNTLNKWCKPIQKDLLQLGMIPGARMLPPVVVKYIAEKFCIDLSRIGLYPVNDAYLHSH